MNKKTNMPALKTICIIFFVTYIIIMIYFMLFADSFNRVGKIHEYRYNLIPFREIKRYPRMKQAYGTLIAFVNLVGNIIVFMPLGFFIPFLKRNLRHWYFIAISGFMVSLIIETIQLILRVGVFDVDDIILNTIGTIIGYMCYYITFLIYVALLKKAKKEKICD